ncbi:3-hydroxyisobutyrate dehydrogenase, mitochondrial [Larimichthys crocea]|uniref:Uncharacterized protein n=1 Tax=Larimichthys crocea TaxID=215358 RepID=A0ACD3RGT2_LARCR|nr:3-hydroxyisobutyrate dehydrogenase, mitochondrial [Larimichthys crocea]
MGAVFMDAPVSGGVGAASLAKLTFMVGGVEEEYNAAQELLTCMGANVVYCGQVGTGQAAKICNNMLLAIGMIGTAETMNLGIRLGLDPKLLAKILNMSSGRCWSSDTYNPVPGVMEGVPSANNYQGGFGTTLMAKGTQATEGPTEFRASRSEPEGLTLSIRQPVVGHQTHHTELCSQQDTTTV